MGSYDVECIVLEKVSEKMYKIKYFDPVEEEEIVKVVEESRLLFPKHSDILI
jgi:hypothetical protein